jgi:hypothetical protein
MPLGWQLSAGAGAWLLLLKTTDPLKSAEEEGVPADDQKIYLNS